MGDQCDQTSSDLLKKKRENIIHCLKHWQTRLLYTNKHTHIQTKSLKVHN